MSNQSRCSNKRIFTVESNPPPGRRNTESSHGELQKQHVTLQLWELSGWLKTEAKVQINKVLKNKQKKWHKQFVLWQQQQQQQQKENKQKYNFYDLSNTGL